MARYKVMWEIDIDDDEASSPAQAARAARMIQMDPENIASVYTVIDTVDQEVYNVDLYEELA